jgi:hypothetical protein
MFAPGKPFQSSLMSVGKELTLEWSTCLTHKQYTILERLARDKYSSLFKKFVTNVHKKFYNIGPRWQLDSSICFATYVL